MKNDKLVEILESLRDDDGLIRETSVVDFARPVKSPLHDEFEWNNQKAGDQFRLLQATELIHKAHVILLASDDTERSVRAFVSLASDRVSGGGYRIIREVLTDEALRAEMLKTALAELNNLQKRFKDLQELKPIFAVIKRVVKRQGKNKLIQPAI